MPKTPDTPPNLDHGEIRRLLSAHVASNNEPFPSIDLPTALHVQAHLSAQQSSIPRHIKSQGERIYKDWRSVLEPLPDKPGAYVITDDLLRGLIAHTGILASMQAVLENATASLKREEERLVENTTDSLFEEEDTTSEPLAA